MTFNRKLFFYLFLVLWAVASCSTAKPFLKPENPPPSDFLPPGPQAEAYYHFLLGQTYQQRGQTDKALLHFQQALEKDPASPYLQTNLAALYLKQGSPEKALLQAEKAIQADPKIVHEIEKLAFLHFKPVQVLVNSRVAHENGPRWEGNMPESLLLPGTEDSLTDASVFGSAPCLSPASAVSNRFHEHPLLIPDDLAVLIHRLWEKLVFSHTKAVRQEIFLIRQWLAKSPLDPLEILRRGSDQ